MVRNHAAARSYLAPCTDGFRAFVCTACCCLVIFHGVLSHVATNQYRCVIGCMLLLELCCHLRFDESIGDDDHAAFAKQMFKLQCKFLPTPGIWIIFQRTFAQRSMRPPDHREDDRIWNSFCRNRWSERYECILSTIRIIDLRYFVINVMHNIMKLHRNELY